MDGSDKVFAKIAEALLTDYTSVYYVDAVTNEYQWYSINPEFHSLQIEPIGKDFFENVAKDAMKVVHPDDLHIFTEDFKKERLLSELKYGNDQRIQYRLMIDGKPVYHALKLIRGVSEGEDDYFILGVKNVDAEVREKIEAMRFEREREIFNHIAEGLASHYDVIYYVDCYDDSYIEYSSTSLYRHLNVPPEGADFFTESKKNIALLIHPDDVDRVTAQIDKDHIITALGEVSQFVVDYRLKVDDVYQYTRFKVMHSTDKSHFIIAVENITERINKEKEYLAALSVANERARRDELTSVGNHNAYNELEASIQSDIDSGSVKPFGIVICDINDLKIVNDCRGHKAGDDYIKMACQIICEVYAHSPVFRVGGDEFVVVLSGCDYDDREKLLREIRGIILENIEEEDIPVVATGMSAFNPDKDTKVSDVFERADIMMYDNKRVLKYGF